MYNIQFTRQAQKDAVRVRHAGLKPKVDDIINTVIKNPYEESQGFEVLKHDFAGTCSRRINRHHRFHYDVLPNADGLKDENDEPYEGIIKVISMWTHYHKEKK
jgi:Txe/YoeB family toxin of toxin-antitoxin system